MLEFGRKNYFAEVTCQSEVRAGGKLRDDVGAHKQGALYGERSML